MATKWQEPGFLNRIKLINEDTGGSSMRDKIIIT